MKRSLLNTVLDDQGQDLAEYGLLCGFIAFIVVAGVTAFGQALLDFWMVRIATRPW